jgi:four helix bundle protein
VLAKLAIVEEEADETIYWLELLVEAEIASEARVTPLLKESHEIVAMIVASIKTLRSPRFSDNPKSKIENPKFSRR